LRQTPPAPHLIGYNIFLQTQSIQDGASQIIICRVSPSLRKTPPISADENSRHVRAIPWPSRRARARRRIATVHAGRLHGREHTRGHVRGGGVRRGKGCRRCRRSGRGPPAWCNAHGRGHHPAARRTCTQRAGRPTRRTGGRVGSTATRRGASNRTGRWRKQPPTRRRNRSWRTGTITRGSSWALRTPEVAARGRRAQLGEVGGGRGAGAVRDQ